MLRQKNNVSREVKTQILLVGFAKIRVPDKSKASPNRPQRFFDKSSSFCLVSKFHKHPKRTHTKPPKLHIHEGGQVSLAQILPSTECSTQVSVYAANLANFSSRPCVRTILNISDLVLPRLRLVRFLALRKITGCLPN